MGLSTANLVRSLWAVGCAMVVTVAAIALAGSFTLCISRPRPAVLAALRDSTRSGPEFSRSFCSGSFCRVRCACCPTPTSAAAFTAGLFAVAHLPNPILTLITLVFGLASCFFFLYYRNLVPLALAHAMLGICIGITIPASMDHNMRVGIELSDVRGQGDSFSSIAVSEATATRLSRRWHA